MTTRIHTPKHSKVQPVFARDVLGDDEKPNENNAPAVWIIFPKNHGISSHWWFGDPRTPPKAESTPPFIGGSHDS